MDHNITDYKDLKAKRCPDCGNIIRRTITNTNDPWCEYCDVYFTYEDMNNTRWVVRNKGAKKLNDSIPKDYYDDESTGMDWW